MKKFLEFTSEKEYKTPTIEIQELEKRDVLTASDNGGVEAQDLLSSPSPGDAPKDLMDSIFGPIGG